jgi:hypothetical protein
VNKNVKLDDLQVYGFDYDYTLSHYSEHLQCLIYDLAKKHLVDEVCNMGFTVPWFALHQKMKSAFLHGFMFFSPQLKYPETCLQFEYDRNFPIRGLYYDRLKGCLLKLDFFGSIEPDGCFIGRRKVRQIIFLLLLFSAFFPQSVESNMQNWLTCTGFILLHNML